MKRILRHVGAKDFRKTHQRKLDEQRALYLERREKEIQEEEQKKNIEEAAKPFKSDWRRETLREFGEWAPIEGSGPTNSTSTTFGYFAGGSPVINGETGQQVTFTYSGLDGVENYPTSVTIDQGFGDTFQTDPPPFSQLGVQGYTAKLNPRYKEAQEKYKKEYDEFKAKSDANFQAIKDTLKSFGTSWEEMRASKKWVKKLSDGTVVAIVPTSSNPSLMDWTNNVRVTKMKQSPNASGPMTINYNPSNEYYDWVVENSEIESQVYLEIGQPPEPPMESEYLMPRRTDYRDVNPLLDASQEFAQQVDADEFMNARVQDAPEQPSFFDYDPSKMGREVAQVMDGEEDDNEILNKAIDLLNLGLDVAAVIGVLFPEPGTTAGGITRLVTRGQRYSNIIGKALQWYNKGRRPGENKMTRMDRFRDEWNQRQRTSADPNSPFNPFRGMPGYGTAKSKLNPRIRAINNRRASQGKSPLSMDKINPGGAQTGPTPTFRQAIERQSSGTVTPLNKSYVRRKKKKQNESTVWDRIKKHLKGA